MATRKFISIATYGRALYALADDGTIWQGYEMWTDKAHWEQTRLPTDPDSEATDAAR